jgi:hypothetical protein
MAGSTLALLDACLSSLGLRPSPSPSSRRRLSQSFPAYPALICSQSQLLWSSWLQFTGALSTSFHDHGYPLWRICGLALMPCCAICVVSLSQALAKLTLFPSDLQKSQARISSGLGKTLMLIQLLASFPCCLSHIPFLVVFS